MTILLPTLAVAFAAFCVWLTVRIINRRERWAKWTLAIVVLLHAYPLSIGPAVWVERHVRIPEPIDLGLHYAFRPILWIRIRSHAIDTIFERYVNLWGAVQHNQR